MTGRTMVARSGLSLVFYLALAGGAVVAAMAAMDAFMLAFNAREPEAWAASLNYPHPPH